jgi:hypothetical protein
VEGIGAEERTLASHFIIERGKGQAGPGKPYGREEPRPLFTRLLIVIAGI